MTALNFHDDEDDATRAIRTMAREAYDLHDGKLDFFEAVERLTANDAMDEELRRAIEELGEDEAAELYADAYNDMKGDDTWTDY